jgi:hypothetical protein
MNDESSKSNRIYLLPLAFILGVVPLIVFAKKISIDEVLNYYWSKELDFFSYYKMVWFLVAIIIAVILFSIYFYQKRRLKETYYYLFIEIYAILIIVSTYYSDVLSVALWGFPDRYEGVFVLLSYLIILFITINLVEYEKDLKFLIIVLFISATMISIIGILQYSGVDLFTTIFGKRFILPTEMHNVIDKIDIKFDYIFSTLYNPNYVGSYTGMLLPLAIVLYILTSNKKNKLLLFFFNLLLFSNWLGCLSRAGMLGGVFGIILSFLLLRKEIFNKWKSVIILGIAFLLVFTIMNYTGDGRLVKEIFSFIDEAQIVAEKNTAKLKDIRIDKDQVLILTEEDQLKINLSKNNDLLFNNKHDEQINYSLIKESGDIKLDNDKYEDYKFRLIADKKVLHFEYGKKEIDFQITDSPKKGFWIIGFAGKSYKTGEVEKWGFEGLERLGSGRGYIWSRSIPMLKDTIFTGYGPDLYALYFPQTDNVGKLLNYGTTKVIVDKPHNMYLQIAINTGVISLLVVLTLFGSYIFSSLKLYWRRKLDNFHSKVGVGVFVAVVAYLIAGLFNDSVISVAPVFWILLGMGISINLKLKAQYRDGEYFIN